MCAGWVTRGATIRSIEEKEKFHFDNEWDIHINSEYNEENGYNLSFRFAHHLILITHLTLYCPWDPMGHFTQRYEMKMHPVWHQGNHRNLKKKSNMIVVQYL